jgi:asparagine synthetase B (glutamine-hydrolysing)
LPDNDSSRVADVAQWKSAAFVKLRLRVRLPPSAFLMEIDAKYSSLKEILRSLGKVVLAYSGGVDSTFLLKTALPA